MDKTPKTRSESTTPTSGFSPTPRTSSGSQVPSSSYTTKVVEANYSKRESTTPTNVFKK